MNKTVNINLGGVPFQIDDNAFDKLNAYLNAVKRKFAAVDGKNEIVEDIEARIAEMFQEKLKSSGRKILSLADVDGAISTMGKPDEFEQGYTEADGSFSDSKSGSGSYRVGRKLYRDPDDKILGGVLSGLAKYFGFDNPTWLRVLVALLPFLDIMFLGISTGTLILVYVILWIVVPKAQTSTEKMQMRGEAVNLDNIEKSFSDGFDNVKKNLSRDPNGESFLHKIGNVFVIILKAFAKFLLIIGLICVGMILLSLIIGFLAAAFGIGTSAPFLSNSIFGNGWMSWAAIIGLLLVLLAPVIFLITLFIKLLFKTKTKMPAVALGTLGAFIIGVILSGLSIGSTIQDFRSESEVKETQNLTLNNSEDLFIFGNETTSFDWDDNFSFGFDEIGIDENVNLRILPSTDSLSTITFYKSARGKDRKIAMQRAKNIAYEFKMDGNRLEFDEYLNFDKNKLWRKQRVDVYLRVPDSTIINFDESAQGVLQNAKVAGEYYSDWQLIEGKRWKMLPDRLVRIDAEGNEIIETEIEENDDEVSNQEHVEINLFGNKLLEVDVTEQDENGDAERVVVKLGGEKIVDVKVDENSERIQIETDVDDHQNNTNQDSTSQNETNENQ